MRIYVAGPYTHPDPVENTRRAVEVAEALWKKGHIPFIPHLTLLWHFVAPHSPDFWYAYDFQWQRLCDAVFRIDGASIGADGEVKLAVEEGQPVYYRLEDVPNEGDPRELAEMLREFDVFSRICRARLRAGHLTYGDDWKTKDNLAEAGFEMMDFANYGFLGYLRAKFRQRAENRT